MTHTATATQQAQDLLAFIDASPSPWHAVQTSVAQLAAAGYVALSEGERWQIQSGGRYYVTRGDASLIAFHIGQLAQNPLAERGLTMVGAHTDSPGLRLKPKAAYESNGLVQLGVEVYGGPILATFTDRDLSLAGRINVRDSSTASGFRSELIRFDESLVRLPNLAIHMNREVNEKGLVLNKQTGLPLIFGPALSTQQAISSDQQFRQFLADKLHIAADDLINWELAVYDTQKGSFWGANQDYIANSQLDNLASCHAALTALLATKNPTQSCLVALFDHEEVGSESAVGAAGSLLGDTLSRLCSSLGLDSEDQHRALANSFFISADMAHAYHPNHPGAYEPNHKVCVNAGPVIKSNANQRYSTSAASAARFIGYCTKAGVPYQEYSHRTDLGCGSTIGPIVAARLGVASVDVGNPMWAMHSLRESAGMLDHSYMIAALAAGFGG